jgi:hypothetical protein
VLFVNAMNRIFLCIIAAGFLCVVWGQGPGGNRLIVPGDTGYTVIDSTKAMSQDSLRLKSARKLTVVKRDFTYRQQIGVALTLMAFIAFMMTTAQSWNPK